MSDLFLLQQNLLLNLPQLTRLQQLEVLHFVETLLKESPTVDLGKKERLSSLDEWTMGLIGLIPKENSTEDSLKQAHQEYLLKKYQ